MYRFLQITYAVSGPHTSHTIYIDFRHGFKAVGHWHRLVAVCVQVTQYISATNRRPTTCPTNP